VGLHNFKLQKKLSPTNR